MLQQTLLKRLEALEEIFDPSPKLEKKNLLSLTSLLLHKLEISLETCTMGKLSLTHFKLHTFNNSKSFFSHTSNFQWIEELSFTHFHLESSYFQKTWKNLFHTSHSLRNGLLLSLQPCKLKTFPQKGFSLSMLYKLKPSIISCFNIMSFLLLGVGP
jgi:hypothetical protein